MKRSATKVNFGHRFARSNFIVIYQGKKDKIVVKYPPVYNKLHCKVLKFRMTAIKQQNLKVTRKARKQQSLVYIQSQSCIAG